LHFARLLGSIIMPMSNEPGIANEDTRHERLSELFLTFATMTTAIVVSSEPIFARGGGAGNIMNSPGLSAAASRIEAAIVPTARATVRHLSTQVATWETALTCSGCRGAHRLLIEAATLLRLHEHIARALTAELLVRRTMTGDEVDEVISAAIADKAAAAERERRADWARIQASAALFTPTPPPARGRTFAPKSRGRSTWLGRASASGELARTPGLPGKKQQCGGAASFSASHDLLRITVSCLRNKSNHDFNRRRFFAQQGTRIARTIYVSYWNSNHRSSSSKIIAMRRANYRLRVPIVI
jgi:hypothetical protein